MNLGEIDPGGAGRGAEGNSLTDSLTGLGKGWNGETDLDLREDDSDSESPRPFRSVGATEHSQHYASPGADT